MGEQKKKKNVLDDASEILYFLIFLTVNHQQTSRQEICKPAASAVEGRNMFSFLSNSSNITSQII